MSIKFQVFFYHLKTTGIPVIDRAMGSSLLLLVIGFKIQD